MAEMSGMDYSDMSAYATPTAYEPVAMEEAPLPLPMLAVSPVSAPVKSKST